MSDTFDDEFDVAAAQRLDAQIAAALGVTRQAAHKKFSRRVSTELRRPRRTETR